MNKWNSSKADFLAGIILVFGGSPEFSGTCPRQSTPLQPHQASSFAVTFQPSKKVEANGRLGAVRIKRWTWKSPVFEKENHLNKLSKPLGFHINLQGCTPKHPPFIDWRHVKSLNLEKEMKTKLCSTNIPSFQVPYEISRAYVLFVEIRLSQPNGSQFGNHLKSSTSIHRYH